MAGEALLTRSERAWCYHDADLATLDYVTSRFAPSTLNGSAACHCWKLELRRPATHA
jgi:hypothetical protein